VQQAYDLFAWQGDHYLVLEHVDGADLREWLERVGPPPPRTARCLELELARGIEALHAAGIVHADLRAENVRIGRWGEVKLEGLGRARGGGETDAAAREPTADAPPEVAAGSLPDARSDVHALARIALELSGARGLPRLLRRAGHADPRRRPSITRLRARLERSVADPAPAAVRAQIAAWLLEDRAGARPLAAADRAPGSAAGPSIARRAALVGVAAGLVAALIAGWDRRDSPLPGPPEAAAPAPPPVDAAPPAADTATITAPAAAPMPTGEPARVRFAVFPWGAIRIDGGEPILTPRAEPVELSAGAHRIEIAHPTLGTERREITLAAGERVTLRHVFDRTPVP
jgi:hypothetical protein